MRGREGNGRRSGGKEEGEEDLHAPHRKTQGLVAEAAAGGHNHRRLAAAAAAAAGRGAAVWAWAVGKGRRVLGRGWGRGRRGEGLVLDRRAWRGYQSEGKDCGSLGWLMVVGG